MYVTYDKSRVVVSVSDQPAEVPGCTTVLMDGGKELVGKFLTKPAQEVSKLKVAVVCNWGDSCGISTYSKYLVDALAKRVAEVKVFSEDNDRQLPGVEYCWKRGHSMTACFGKIKEYSPDFVIVQHEFGIFPKATHFLKMLEMLEEFPHVVCMHSVYEHLDKTVCTSAAKNVVVHSEQARDCLRRLGGEQNVFVVPHGCLDIAEPKELWNIFQVPYVLVQFGFGFSYKGVDRAIEAVSILKRQKKFEEVFYVYLCSNSGKFDGVHNKYYSFLKEKIEEFGLEENVAVIRKYHSEDAINNYLRTAKIALFPYTTDPDHTVYGASGAVRIAIANGIPTVASESHMFDDLDGVLPRPDSAHELAKEIDEIFSNDSHRDELKARMKEYAKSHTWDHTARAYLDAYRSLNS